MKLIVGLGNPGKEYINTRHNVGFRFLDAYLNHCGFDNSWTSKFDGLYKQINYNGTKVILLKPQTYMNLSGNSVRKTIDYFNIDISDIIVISDDLDLNIGNFKLRENGSSGGHNGLKDIENKIGSNQYKRLKIGISNNKALDTKDYVLGNFNNEENKILDDLFKLLFNVLDDYFITDFSDLMNKYNRKNR